MLTSTRRLAVASLLPAALLLPSVSCAEIFGVDHPEIGVSAYLTPPTTGPFEIVARVGDARATLTVDAATPAREKTLHGARYGSVPGSVVLRNGAGETLATVQFTQRLERDAGHWVSAAVGNRRPEGFCMGELVLAPVNGSGTDTLFVHHGGLRNGLIC